MREKNKFIQLKDDSDIQIAGCVYCWNNCMVSNLTSNQIHPFEKEYNYGFQESEISRLLYHPREKAVVFASVY